MINNPSSICAAMITQWKLPETLFGDTPAMRAASTTYLPQRSKESDAAYDVRLNETTLVNYLTPAIESLSGKVFSKEIVVGENLKPYQDWLDNIDMEGSNINEFGKELFVASALRGVTYIVVDAPFAVKADNLKDQKNSNVRPYLVHVTANQIIGFKTRIINNVKTLSEVRISETIIETDEDYNEVEKERVRKLFIPESGGRAGWEIHEPVNTDKGIEWVKTEEGLFSVDYITIIPYYTNKQGFMQARTYFTTLCYINLQHWNSSSYQRNILNTARVPRLTGFGFGEDEIKEFEKHGVANGVFSTNKDATAGWMECEGKSIGHGERDLKSMEEQMALLSLDPILKKETTTDLATVANIESSKSNSVIEQWAGSLQAALIDAIVIMGELANRKIDKPDIKVNDEYQLIDNSAVSMKELREQRGAGDLSRRTLLTEAKRIGFYDDDFDVDTEISLIKAEENDEDEGFNES